MKFLLRILNQIKSLELSSLLKARLPFLAFFGLVITVVLGAMNVIHVLTYLKPTDGARYQQNGNQLRVLETDLSVETSLQVGDVLLRIDETEIRSIQDYEDVLYNLTLGSKHLYLLERHGQSYEPWVTIRGEKTINWEYYLFAFTGFVYLLFCFMVWNQETGLFPKRALIFFCITVFWAFVFHHTQRLSPLDWVSYYLDTTGRFLLPSALLSVVLGFGHRQWEWRGFLQVLHWAPTTAMAFVILFLFPQSAGNSAFTDEAYYHLLQDIQRVWGGVLIGVCLLAALLFKPVKGSKEAFTLLLGVLVWLPFALDLLHLEYPYSFMWTSILPASFPILILFQLGRSGNLHLAPLGKKGVVYFIVILTLFIVYFSFIRIFQTLLGGSVTRDGQIMLSGFGIMFAGISYGPLKNLVQEVINRMIYGERFSAIQSLLDLSAINRADTEMETFLHEITDRINRAFGFDVCWFFVEGNRIGEYRSLSSPLPVFELPEKHWPKPLLVGDPIRLSQVQGLVFFQKDHPSEQMSNLMWALRVSGQIKCLLILPGGPQDPQLNVEELQLMRGLLNQCEVLLENMDLYRSLELRAQSFIQLKEFNENIIESSKLGMLATDEVDFGVSCNAAFCELAGLQKEKIIGLPFFQIFSPVDVQNERALKTGRAQEGVFENQRGDQLLLDILKTPLKTKDNEIFGNLYLIEDIRDKRKIQDQMMQQEKLASIGLLAAGVAHEINTPLTGIASYSQMLKSSSLPQDDLELVDLIQQQSHRAAEIVKELLNFSRKESKPKGPVDLVQVVKQTLTFLMHRVQKRGVDIELVEPENPQMVLGFANQLQQVFINITVNALDAMGEEGRFVVVFEECDQEVRVACKDSGQGMDDETVNRIFDPFFTTKEVGKGTGLGMSVVYNILQDHDAFIDIQSEIGVGTTITLTFKRLISKGAAAHE